MLQKTIGILSAGLLLTLTLGLSQSAWAEPTGYEIVKHCEYKNPGDDQRSLLSITLIDKDGNKRKNIYQRLWKNYYGKNDIVDKMVLFTDFPPDAKGTGFMRWGYAASSGKMADQWLYLPKMRKIRRVTVRDPGDSFLGSDLTYGDMEDRPVEFDSHKFITIETLSGQELYRIESTPKEASSSLYSKKVSWYKKTVDWESCVRVRTDYYDRHQLLLKTQLLKWQKVGNAEWAWDTVLVKNVQTNHQSIFQVTDVEVGVGLKDRDFTERALKKGSR